MRKQGCVSQAKWWMMMWVSVMGISVMGCGPSLPGQVVLVDTISQTSTSRVLVVDKYLYALEGEKLIIYNLTKPEAPTKEGQQDSFAGPHLGMVPFGTGQMMILGADGTVQVFNISSPGSPLPVWGAGKTLKLKYPGPFVIRNNPLVMYSSPGNDVAIARTDLGELTKPDADQNKLDAASTKIDGGGGGGIFLAENADKIPVALYIGNKKTGKLDYWNVPSLEANTAKAPTASIDIKAGTDVKRLFMYTVPDNTRGYLMVLAASGGLEYFDLGNEYNSVAQPKAVTDAGATINDMYILDLKRKLLFSTTLDIFSYTDFKKPGLWGQPTTRAVIEVSDMTAHPSKDFLYVAEKAGLRVYSFGTKAP